MYQKWSHNQTHHCVVHAGALAQSNMEKAQVKNKNLSQNGCFVPESFDDFGRIIKIIYEKLLKNGVINGAKAKARMSIEPPPIPLDYQARMKSAVDKGMTKEDHSPVEC